MTIHEIRDTELYDKHFDSAEPEQHYDVSIEFAIETLGQLLSSSRLVGLGDRIVHAEDIENIIADLKKQLLSS